MKKLLAGALVLTHTLALANPPIESVRLRSFQHSGTGCPTGSLASMITKDTATLTLLFDRYSVDVGESPSGLAQKDCRVTLDIETPRGYQFALYRIDYRGYAELPAGAKGSQSSAYSFGTSSLRTQLAPLTLKGPFQDDYQHSVLIPISAAEFSRCGDGGGSLINIDTNVRVEARGPKQQIQLSSSSGRQSEVELGQAISDIYLVKKDSAAACLKNISFGAKGSKAWVNFGCRGTFEVGFAGGRSSRPQGLMTVDSLDGYVNQDYAINWRPCEAGRWVQAANFQTCKDVCRKAGMASARDDAGAECASGEARPASAIGKVNFSKGCWGECSSMGDIRTDVLGPFCYKPGQSKDADKTDFTIACYCN